MIKSDHKSQQSVHSKSVIVGNGSLIIVNPASSLTGTANHQQLQYQAPLIRNLSRDMSSKDDVVVYEPLQKSCVGQGGDASKDKSENAMLLADTNKIEETKV